jgi:hypothetical protein
MGTALEKIRADLERHRRLFNLDRGGLGAALCKAATDGVQECIAGEHSPEGAAWPALSERYEQWKSFEFPGQPMGVLYQHMADPHEVAGEVEVTATRAMVTYGRTDQARAEAVFFQDPEGSNQPPRKFWGFTDESLKEVRKLLDDRFKEA